MFCPGLVAASRMASTSKGENKRTKGQTNPIELLGPASFKVHLPLVERRDGTLEEGGTGVGERSRSLGRIRRPGDGLLPPPSRRDT
jgi:hypothetical protein